MKNRDRSTRWIALMALFIALQLFLNISGIGLIPLPIIKGTTLHIPVIIGAIMLGPMAGGILGGMFGLCSIWNNTMTPAVLSFAFSPIIAAQETGAMGAVKSLWIVLGCRIMIGVVAGWLWIALKKYQVSDYIALPIVGAAGALTNTILVMGSIYVLLTPEYAAAQSIPVEAVLGTIMGVVGTSGVTEAIGAVILVTAICKALFHVPALRPKVQANGD
ncbi:ECF transporter S component [bacterium 1xD42-67]|nr:ECF transporter S component [bacterium 1xD42-67]